MSGPPPPPPPPPHGESPKTTAGGGLPPGKYDIFVIPQHSAGSGFLYLPSLKPNINSFVAGFASALALVVLGQSMAPAFRAWWANFQGMGNMGMLLLLIAVGLGAWSLGRTQQDGVPGGSDSSPGHDRSGQGSPSGQGSRGTYDGARPSHEPPPNSAPPPQPDPPPGPPPRSAPPPHSAPPPRHRAEPPPQPQQEAPKSSWQKPPPHAPKPEAPKGAWEKAREETRRKEEERRAEEEAKKRKEAAAQRLKELREKEARERAQREKERQERELREQAEKARKEKELRELREKEQREREQRAKELREKLEREAKLKAEQERLKKEEEEKQTRKGSTYAFSAVGERTNPWPNSRPPAASRPAAPSDPSASPSAPPSAAPSTASARSSAPASSTASSRAPPSATASATSSATARPSPTPKKPKTPTAKTFAESEEEMYSFRPYDKPKRPSHKKSVSDFSETSWTPSYSTANTTPPPSARGPYSTKDPDKIVIKAVYSFLTQFAKTPSSQLISGVGNVTDGLILHITTEGLFIDDDVRGVPQREWDVKAWTLKLVEVWCPSHVAAIANAADKVASKGASAAPDPKTASFLRRAMWRRGTSRDPKPLAGEDANAYLVDLMAECEDNCRLGLCNFASPAPGVSASASAAASASTNRSQNQTGGWNAKGLHLLRATLRDQDEKRYLFVLGEEEAWKLALGVQRLIKGRPATTMRSVGVAGLSAAECRSALEMLGWSS